MKTYTLTLTSGELLSSLEVMKMKKDDLLKIALAESITVDPAISLKDLRNHLIQELGELDDSESVDIELSKKPATEAQLKKRAEVIKAKAKAIQEHIESIQDDPDKLATFYATGFADAGLSPEDVADFFDMSDPAQPQLLPVVSDLPPSKIIGNLPIRVITQVVYSKLVKYPMMKLVKPEMVANGVKQIVYKDFRDADDESGFSDVTIGNYNLGFEPLFQETYSADTNIHKGYDVLDTSLNNVAMTPALFIAMTNDFALAIGHPIAKVMYQRFVAFLADVTNHDENLTFSSADIKETQKELYEHLVSLATPSRNNLKVKPNGSSMALEFTLDLTNTTLLVNKDYSGNWKYDLNANTFQLAEITMQFKEILVQDFVKIDEYNTSANKLNDQELLIIEDGVYGELIHFIGTKSVDTPKMKSVVHQYHRVKNYRRKDKYLASFKKFVTK